MKPEQSRSVPARKAPKDQVGPRVVKSIIAKHVAAFAKADAGTVAPAVRPAAPTTARTTAPSPPPPDRQGHAVIPARFQSGVKTTAPAMASAAAPVAKNRDLHPASAPHPAHSGKLNRR